MKKLIAIMVMMLAMVVTSCQKKVDIGAITLGETYDETIQSLEREEAKIERKDDGSIIGEGEIYVLDMCFDNAICEFENDKLTKVSLSGNSAHFQMPQFKHSNVKWKRCAGMASPIQMKW